MGVVFVGLDCEDKGKGNRSSNGSSDCHYGKILVADGPFFHYGLEEEIESEYVD